MVMGAWDDGFCGSVEPTPSRGYGSGGVDGSYVSVEPGLWVGGVVVLVVMIDELLLLGEKRESNIFHFS